MIVDGLAQGRRYAFGPFWQQALSFLETLGPETAAGEYPIAGTDLFARVMTYDTRLPGDALLEAHRDYVDIQSVLVGAEGCEWFPQADLPVACAYDAAKDAELYHRPGPAPARIAIVPGRFVALWPGDAHLLGVQLGERSLPVKKVVVKVRAALLRS